jgi:hypothetical protein
MSELPQRSDHDKSGLPVLEGRRENATATTSAPQSDASSLLSGTIKNYRKRREIRDFLITPTDRKATGATAILAALAGQGGTAIAGLNAMNIREEADFVEFEIDGKSVNGWLTFAPFKEGDHVEMVAAREGDRWHVFGIVRADYVTALHPCCSRGRYAHFKATAKWWLVISSVLVTLGLLMVGCISVFEYGYRSILDLSFWLLFAGGSGGGFFLLSALVAASQSRKFMPAVCLAESIFAGFGWKNVKSIDLPAITKKYRLAGEGREVGMLYFRCGKDSLDERLTGTSRV